MTIALPVPIARYFATDASKDADAIAACFTPTAVVRDEGRIHAGREAIRAWKAQTAAEFTYTVTPFVLAAEGDRLVVTSHLVGTFPGSPVDLRYVFLLAGDAIAALEIVP